LARKTLRPCDLVTAREPQSFNAINVLIPDKAELYPDMAFRLVAESPEWAQAELVRHGVPVLEKTCVGITMRPYRFPDSRNPSQKYATYIQSFAKLLEYLLENDYVPVLYAHTIGPNPHEDDRIALRHTLEAVSKADRVFYIHSDYNCRQIKSLYGLMDFMICTRFHSAIFSIAQQVPCLAISYQGPKAEGIMEEAGLKDFVYSIYEIDADLLIEAFERLVSKQEEVKQKMNVYMSDCLQRLNELDELVMAKSG
jgi:colanic acid/amylovoran biosynthesis protein